MLALWMYFWDSDDWVAAAIGPTIRYFDPGLYTRRYRGRGF